MLDSSFKKYCGLLLKQFKEGKLSFDTVVSKLANAKKSLFTRITEELDLFLEQVNPFVNDIEKHKIEIQERLDKLSLNYWEKAINDDPEICPDKLKKLMEQVRNIELLVFESSLPNVPDSEIIIESDTNLKEKFVIEN